MSPAKPTLYRGALPPVSCTVCQRIYRPGQRIYRPGDKSRREACSSTCLESLRHRKGTT